METYMERRLTGLHEAGSTARIKEKFGIFIVGLLATIFLPFVHLGILYYIWVPDKPKVDLAKCQCDCFDTVFRGRYESPPSGYKHVYFNCTSNTLKIWFVLATGILLLYECIRYVAPLIWHGRHRNSMLMLLFSAVYPHYYGWWMFFNYYNENFYYYWYHQLIFSVTELISSAMVVHLINRSNRIEPWKLLIIININVMHIIVSGLDQFIDNVIYRRGKGFEAVRDLALMVPDIFHVLLCYFELGDIAERKRVNLFRLFYKEEIMASLILVTLVSLLAKNL